ncbi:MAG: dTDP-4-dehydrorhamnose reductase [Balneolaceae bacterium]
MLKIAITGSTGQLGREWCRFLEKNQNEALLLPLTRRELDITDSESVGRTMDSCNPDIVINCAAYTDVDGAEDDPGSAYAVNEEGVRNLAEWCASHKRLLVHYSTDYIFPGVPEARSLYPDGYPEDARTGPVNRYGASKLAGESALKESGAPFLILRTSWLCGVYGNNFIRTMLKLSQEREELRIVNDQFGSPSFAENVVYNSWNLMEQEEEGVFHITGSGLTTWYGFASELFAQTGSSVRLQSIPSDQFPQKAARPAFSKLSTNKLAAIPGCRLEDWRVGLGRLLKQI